MSTAEQIKLLALGNTELNERVSDVEKKIDSLENDIPLYGCEIDDIKNHVNRKVVNVLGGKTSEAYRDGSIRSSVFKDIYRQLKREYGCVSSYKSIKRKWIDDAHDLISGYEVPKVLEEPDQICKCSDKACVGTFNKEERGKNMKWFSNFTLVLSISALVLPLFLLLFQ